MNMEVVEIASLLESPAEQPQGVMPEPYANAAVVAAYMACSRQWVSHLAATGELKSFKIGRMRRFRISDVDLMMARHAVGGHR